MIIYQQNLFVLRPWHNTGVQGSDVPWLDRPASNAVACVITVTE